MHGLKKLTPRPHHGTNVERPLTKFTKIFCSVAQLFPGSSSPQLVVELLQAFVPRNNILEIRSNVPFTSTFGNPVMWPSKLMHRHHASIEKSHPQLQVASPFQQKKRTKLQMQSRLLSQPKFSTNGPDNITNGPGLEKPAVVQNIGGSCSQGSAAWNPCLQQREMEGYH